MAVEWKDADGTAATVTRRDTRGGPSYEVVFTYKVDGEWYGGTFTTGDEYNVGDSVAVRYDPKRPERNDLVVAETRKRWIGVAVLAAAVIGGLCLVLFSRR